MGQVLHGSATTTEAIRRAIQNSQESLRAGDVRLNRQGSFWIDTRWSYGHACDGLPMCNCVDPIQMDGEGCGI